MERITCSCRGQYALKRGRSACVCKQEGWTCVAPRKCDKSKCKKKVNM